MSAAGESKTAAAGAAAVPPGGAAVRAPLADDPRSRALTMPQWRGSSRPPSRPLEAANALRKALHARGNRFRPCGSTLLARWLIPASFVCSIKRAAGRRYYADQVVSHEPPQ